MTYIPRHNAPSEHKEWVLWAQKRLLDQDAKIEQLLRNQDTAGKQVAVGASHTTTVNVQGVNNSTDITELKARETIPSGGTVGMTLTRDIDGVPAWTSVPYSVVPEYWVSLEDGNPSWGGNHSELGENGLPPVLFDLDGHRMLPIENNDSEHGWAPMNLSVDVVPHFDDEEFWVHLPATGSFANGSPPFFTLRLWNHTNYRATVVLEDTTLHYAGTTTFVYTPGFSYARSLAPHETLNWWVQGGGHDATMAAVTPLSARTYPESTDVGYEDRFYTRSVASLREHATFSVFGALEVVSGGPVFRNGDLDAAKVLGNVVASVAVAPVGADVLVDVKRNGASVFTSPITIAAGETTASKVPDVLTHTNGFPPSAWSVAGFDPGDEITVDVLQVGGVGTEGSHLTVQVYFG